MAQPKPLLQPTAHIVALAASVGGLRALSEILSNLPADFPAPIVVVQHLDPQQPSRMAEIISYRTSLIVKQAEEADRLHPGWVYIAPPDKHLLVNSDETLSLSDSARVRFSRPAANNLFESVAKSFKERAIAVVLTGRDGDGATGVQAIKRVGGTVIVQDEASCECFSMPESAIALGCVDFVLPLSEIAKRLSSLVKSTV